MDAKQLVTLLLIALGVGVALYWRRVFSPADRKALVEATLDLEHTREALTEVRIADERLVVFTPVDGETSMALAAVDAVGIETDDSGPAGTDVWWIVQGGDTRLTIPLGATGEDALLAWVQSLPGVDNEAIVHAMGSTTVGRFVVWQRPAGDATQPG